jgi:sulfide:quinone oxidoreductase
MLADRAYEMGAKPEISFITPEPAPLALFGADAAARVDGLLRAAGIRLYLDATASLDGPRTVHTGQATIEADRVISLPRLEGPALPGLPADARGFLVTDAHARVLGVPDVYAAGDVTAFAIKQGGLACQQADAAAAHIAAQAGAPVTPEPFAPVLRGILVTEHSAHFLRAGRKLWWPPAKIAGRELAGYLQGLDDEAGRPAGLPVNVDMAEELEVLSLAP